MPEITFKEGEGNISVNVNCTFSFISNEEKQRVMNDLKETDWDCLIKLAKYLEEH